MTGTRPPRTRRRPTHSILHPVLLVVALSAAAVGCAQYSSYLPTAIATALAPVPTGTRAPSLSSSLTAPPRTGIIDTSAPGELGLSGRALPAGSGGVLGVADGVVPSHTTVFDDALPGVAKLDPALRDALRRASTDARRAGVRLYVDSGWRSRKYQKALFREAVSEFGSEAEASRRVASPGTSSHESGNAVDIGRSDADSWLSKHGAAYGLCQIYRNEPWHFELRSGANTRGCPPMYADASRDPRIQQ